MPRVNHPFAERPQHPARRPLGCCGALSPARGAALLVALLVALPGRADPPAPVESLARLRSLSAAEASRRLPVHVQATVAYSDPTHNICYVEDGTWGALVRFPTMEMPPAIGQTLAVRGETAAWMSGAF